MTVAFIFVHKLSSCYTFVTFVLPIVLLATLAVILDRS
jgi:hypothetical protein